MATLVSDPERKTAARLAGSAVLAIQPDERLARLVRDGHERAFEAIVSRYRPALLRYCSRILPESRTEDAVQQAFMNAHAALLAGEEPQQLRAWLYTITRNSALNMLRQNGWNYEQIPLDFDGVRRPEQVVEQRIELQNTVAAVSALPERQRDAIVMREFEGRSYDEIAAALGANDGAVRQLLNRARGSLRAAAAAIMPPPLVARAASSFPSADGRRLAEVLGSLGAGGVVKVGATALVAGSLVVGAVKAPLPLVGGQKPHRDTATAMSDQPAAKTSAVATKLISAPAQHASERNVAAPRGGHGSRPHGSKHSHGLVVPPQLVSGHDGGGSSGRDHRSGSGGGEDHSGSTRSGSEDRSGTSGSGSRGSEDNHSPSSGSGTSGSGSGFEDNLSGTSGSGTSNTGTSGRDGSSTSGSSDSSPSSPSSPSPDSGSSGSPSPGISTSSDATPAMSSASGSDDPH